MGRMWTTRSFSTPNSSQRWL